MGKIYYIILMIAFLIAIIGGVFLDQQNIQNKKQTLQMSPQLPQMELGSTDYGKVTKIGPYGNKNSPVKIAFIVGVHPLESKAHKAIIESIISQKSLNYCYYIYRIIVTKDAGSYDKGRMNGQLLAKKYVVPDIKKNKFNLVIDSHSNRGKYTNYQETRFLAVPISDNKSKSIAFKIINKIPWLAYYIPPRGKGPSSPEYVTDPLIRSGIPSIVYETYIYEPYEITLEHANEFIGVVDSIKLSQQIHK